MLKFYLLELCFSAGRVHFGPVLLQNLGMKGCIRKDKFIWIHGVFKLSLLQFVLFSSRSPFWSSPFEKSGVKGCIRVDKIIWVQGVLKLSSLEFVLFIGTSPSWTSPFTKNRGEGLHSCGQVHLNQWGVIVPYSWILCFSCRRVHFGPAHFHKFGEWGRTALWTVLSALPANSYLHKWHVLAFHVPKGIFELFLLLIWVWCVCMRKGSCVCERERQREREAHRQRQREWGSVCVVREREIQRNIKQNRKPACLEIDFVYLQRQVYTGSTSD